MKPIFILLISLLTLSASAQLQDEVARLDSIYGVAEQISDHPVTGFQRIAAHGRLEWNSRAVTISDVWYVYCYEENSFVEAQGLLNPYTRNLYIDRTDYVDSLGNEVLSTVPGAIREYDYFYSIIESGAPLLDVIRQNVIKADALGKFD